jgi:3-oxoacyl-[acyl-carrier protein] reductase
MIAHRRRALDRFGRIDAVFNIAGAGAAGVMAFIVSPAARWMTGTVLRMDGGEVKSV